jgi:hypothetical protein
MILTKLSCQLHPQTYEKRKKFYIKTIICSSRVENRLLPVFKNFINDTNADIRTLACQKLPILAQSLE